MLEKSREFEDLSLEEKKKMQAYLARNLCSVSLSNIRMDNHTGKDPAEELTVTTEFSVPKLNLVHSPAVLGQWKMLPRNQIKYPETKYETQALLKLINRKE